MTSTQAPDGPRQPSITQIARQARRIARQGLKASLATRDADSGHPFISMGGGATAMDGAPILLMSSLARHRKNLDKFPQISLLFEEPDERANPLTGARVSLSGRIERLTDMRDRDRFLARQPKAFYAGFSDFEFFRIRLSDVHFVGGFGIAQTLNPEDYLLDTGPIEELRSAESELVTGLNETGRDGLDHILDQKLGAPRGAWRLTGIDPEGCDFMWKHRVRRYDFANRIETPEHALAHILDFPEQ